MAQNPGPSMGTPLPWPFAKRSRSSTPRTSSPPTVLTDPRLQPVYDHRFRKAFCLSQSSHRKNQQEILYVRMERGRDLLKKLAQLWRDSRELESLPVPKLCSNVQVVWWFSGSCLPVEYPPSFNTGINKVWPVGPSGLPFVIVNKALLQPSHAHSLQYYLGLLSYHRENAE